MDSEDTTTTPVIITDGKSHSKMFVTIVSVGLVIACLFVVGTVIRSVSANLAAPKFDSAATKNKDVRMIAACDQLIQSGNFAEARKMLEEAEDQAGLTPELSEKLDGVYMAIAKQDAAKGATKEAIEVLKLIPSESKLYDTAQSTIKSLSAPKAAKSTTKTHSPAHSKKHHK